MRTSASSAMERLFFMTIKDRVYCLTSSSILLPMSVFIAATTFRNMDSLSQMLEIYIITVRFAFSLTGIVAGLLCTFVVVACPKRSLSLVTLLISILSTFGALITVATTIFSTDWADKSKSLTKTIFILTAILSFASALTICVCLLNRFRRPDFSHNDPVECIEHASCILASLFIISAFTSIIGFALGYTVSQQLLGIKILGGGSHSGIFGLLSTTLFILAICIHRRLRMAFLSVSLGLGILALVGSSVSFYTEEMEYFQSIKYIEHNPILFRKSMNLKLLLLTKHTLVLVTSVFNLVFAAPLTVLICCLLKEDLLISSNYPSEYSPARNDCSYNANAYQFSNLHAPLLDNCVHFSSHIESSPTLPNNTNFRVKSNLPGRSPIATVNPIASIVGVNPSSNNNSNINTHVSSTQQNVLISHSNDIGNNYQTCDLLKQLSRNN